MLTERLKTECAATNCVQREKREGSQNTALPNMPRSPKDLFEPQALENHEMQGELPA